jgi:hypothetical protein
LRRRLAGISASDQAEFGNRLASATVAFGYNRRPRMRALLIIFLLGMLTAVGYFAYSAMAVVGEPIPTEGYVALALGAGFSVVVGIGLMVLLFFSSRRGYDEPPHFR